MDTSNITHSNVSHIGVVNNTYILDGRDSDNYLLNGDYKIDYIVNSIKDLEEVPEYHCKAVFGQGKVLYDSSTENIKDQINKIIYYTYNYSGQVHAKEIMAGGTICPSKEVIHIDDKLHYILFGRYLYGYDKNYVKFCPKNEPKGSFKLDTKQIEYEYIYAFAIVNTENNKLNAFGIYSHY